MLILSLTIPLLLGCSVVTKYTKKIFPTKECKIRTYTEQNLLDYLTSYDYLENQLRFGVIPFNVPETFAPPGNDNVHYGREIAKKFTLELQAKGELPIIELFNRDRWPGKREEFFTGNYKALEYGRLAGYDFVVVGYMEDIVNDNELGVYCKIIDTTNGITIWSSYTVLTSNKRFYREAAAKVTYGNIPNRPDLFHFPERLDELAKCTVDKMFSEEME